MFGATSRTWGTSIKFASAARIGWRRGPRAVRLSVTPRYQDRFGYRLWVDEETGLLLRSELKDAEGADLEIFQFTSLRIGDEVAEVDLQPSTEGAVVRSFSDPASAPAAAPNWRARWVPPGFQLTSAVVRAAAWKKAERQYAGVQRWLGGAIRVHRSHAGSRRRHRGLAQWGHCGMTHSTAGDDGDHLVTVVGEVPVATARRVAAGVFQEPR